MLYKDINSISEKIVEKIKELDDNAVASITTLLDGNKYDSKTMFDIYKITVERLKEIGIYLDFGQYENQRVGLPFNIPFKIKKGHRCPNCNERLSKSMPVGAVFFCNKCGKYFKNDNGNVGKETTSPYTRNDVLY